jgi:kynurenine formamidase
MFDKRWKNRPEGSTWGDFGEDDQIGRMNLLRDAHRLRAVREVQEGKVFSLSLPLDYPGGNALAEFRKEPRLFYEKRGNGQNFNFQMSNNCACFNDVVSDDAVLLFTQYSTQWDGLGHVGSMYDADGDGEPEKVYYNGYRGGLDLVGPEDSDTPTGARRLGIENLAMAGVQGRGVLIDLASLYGRERVSVGYDELMQAIESQKAEIGEGDFLCLYTGFADVVLEMNRQPDKEKLHHSCAVLDGRDQKLLDWITDSRIVAICADNFAVEGYPAKPGTGDTYPALPLHNHCLFKLGVHLGELWYFAALAKWLAAHQRNSFLLTAPPLRLPGAVGSPVTPIATV